MQDFIRTFLNVTLRPQSAFTQLEYDRNALSKALLTLAIIVIVYTVILVVRSISNLT